MKLIISNSSPVPIYEQIKKSIITQILEDELVVDETLPSIRALAQDIRVSVLTVKRAYDELEKEGYIVSIQGKGTFVAEKNEALVKERLQKDIDEHLEKAVMIAKRADIECEDLIELLKIFYGDKL